MRPLPEPVPSGLDVCSDTSPGPLVRRLHKVIKLDTPRGVDFLEAMAASVDSMHTKLDRIMGHLGIE